MPVTASSSDHSIETPRALRVAIALGLPMAAAMTVVGTYFGKEILIFAAALTNETAELVAAFSRRHACQAHRFPPAGAYKSKRTIHLKTVSLNTPIRNWSSGAIG